MVSGRPCRLGWYLPRRRRDMNKRDIGEHAAILLIISVIFFGGGAALIYNGYPTVIVGWLCIATGVGFVIYWFCGSP
jgi:hypothetical protein